MELQTSRGYLFYIDAEDFESVAAKKWSRLSKNINAYLYTKIGSRTVTLHSFILGRRRGFVIDHIDGQKYNNRRSNLRFVRHRQNIQRGTKKNPLSGYYGVSLNCKKWSARIRHNYKTLCSPQFENKIDAAKWYDKMAKKLHGKHCRLNFKE